MKARNSAAMAQTMQTTRTIREVVVRALIGTAFDRPLRWDTLNTLVDAWDRHVIQHERECQLLAALKLNLYRTFVVSALAGPAVAVCGELAWKPLIRVLVANVKPRWWAVGVSSLPVHTRATGAAPCLYGFRRPGSAGCSSL